MFGLQAISQPIFILSILYQIIMIRSRGARDSRLERVQRDFYAEAIIFRSDALICSCRTPYLKQVSNCKSKEIL